MAPDLALRVDPVGQTPLNRPRESASIVANIAAVIASAVYIAQGGPSWLGILLLIAAGGLVLSLTAWAARAER